MRADWSAACGSDDPVLVVPWAQDHAGPAAASYIDLRENPWELDSIPEAEQHPVLLHALRALNGGRSSVYTAKCDVWPMDGTHDAEGLAATRFELELEPHDAPSGFASYIDLLFRDRALFRSFHQQEQRLVRMTRLLETLTHPWALAEGVLRPALVEGVSARPGERSGTGDRAQEGFAITLYVRALGADPVEAYRNWASALEATVALVRGREFNA